MSLRKGVREKRGQKHQNTTAYKAGLHGCPQRLQEALSVPLAGVCARCREKIEWKRKYDKYKPLTVPKKCTVCLEKRVRQAYYQLCKECAESHEVCAKCGKKEEVVERFPLSSVDQVREEARLHEAVRRLSERERRSLLRSQERKVQCGRAASGRTASSERTDSTTASGRTASSARTDSPTASGRAISSEDGESSSEDDLTIETRD